MISFPDDISPTLRGKLYVKQPCFYGERRCSGKKRQLRKNTFSAVLFFHLSTNHSVNLQLLFPYPLNFLPYVLCLSLSASSLHPSSSWIDRLLPVFSRVTAQFRDHGVHVTNHLCVCVCVRVGVFARIVKGLRGHRGLWYQQSYQSL